MQPSSVRKIEQTTVPPSPQKQSAVRVANDATTRAYVSNNQQNQAVASMVRKNIPLQQAANDAQPNLRPRDAAIRQAANDNMKVRKVETVQPPISTHPTVSEEFAAEYAERSSLQPSVGPMIDYANTASGYTTSSQSPRRAQRERSSEVVSNMRNTVVEKRLVPAGTMKKLTHARNLNDVTTAVLPGALGKAATYAEAVEEATVLTEITIAIYLGVQLWIAIICAIAFAAAGIWQSAENAIRSSAAGNFLWNVGSYIVKGANGVLNYFLGFDLSVFHPLSLLMFFTALAMLCIWIQLAIIGFTYVILGIPCFNGKGSILKYFFFIMAMVGGLPVLNFVPWATLWAWAVASNPTDDES